MRVEEKSVHSPRIRLAPPVHVVEGRDVGQLTVILVSQVFEMSGMLDFRVVNPCDTCGDCVERVRASDRPQGRHALAGPQT